MRPKRRIKKSFNRIADNYLPSLRAVDQQAYYHVLGNVIKDTILTMVREGRALGDQGAAITGSGQHPESVCIWFTEFHSTYYSGKTGKSAGSKCTATTCEQATTDGVTAISGCVRELQTKANNVLKATIDGHIDPRHSMTDYVKKNASKDAMDKLEDLMGRDQRFRGLLDRLWEKSYERGFDKETTDKIKSAYLSKAKTLLPSVIKKARNDALRGHADSDSGDTRPEKKGPITPGRSTSNVGGKIS